MAIFFIETVWLEGTIFVLGFTIQNLLLGYVKEIYIGIFRSKKLGKQNSVHLRVRCDNNSSLLVT